MTLSERYRPATLQEVVGQDKAVKILARVTSNGIGGRAYYVSGISGSGKTTIARILAKSIVTGGFDTVEVVARDLTPLGLKDITRRWVFKGGHCLIVNESGGLAKPVIELFLQILEDLPAHVAVIFTTTKEQELNFFEDKTDALPFVSRCVTIPLESRGLAWESFKNRVPGPFALRAKEIAEKEGLNGQPIEAYCKLAQKHKNNLRAMLRDIECGVMLTD